MKKLNGQLKLYTAFCLLNIILIGLSPLINSLIPAWINHYNTPAFMISWFAGLAIVWVWIYRFTKPNIKRAERRGNIVTLKKGNGKDYYLVTRMLTNGEVRLEDVNNNLVELPVKDTKLEAVNCLEFLKKHNYPITVNVMRGDGDEANDQNIIILWPLVLKAIKKISGTSKT